MNRLLLALGLLVTLAFPSVAQVPTPPPTSVLAGQVALSVTNTSARVALPSTAPSANAVTIYNKGTVDAYYALGSSSVVATTSSTQIPAGSYITVYVGTNTNIAAITASSTTSLVIYQSNGPVQFGLVGSPNGASPTGTAGGDLGGTYPNPTVVGGTNLTGAIGSTGVTSYKLGTPGFTLTGGGVFGQWTGTNTSYLEFDLQNTSNGASASTDIVLNSDNATNTTHYINYGKNSSGFTGTGSFNLAGAGYLYTATDDLVIGTTTNNSFHVVTNNGATDDVTISGTHAITINDVTGFPASGITLLGSSTGKTTFASANASATNYTLTFPAATGNVVLASAGATGSISASNIITGGIFSTANGSTSVPASTATTIVTLPSGAAATYIVSAGLNGTANQAFQGVSIISTDGIAASITSLQTGASLTISLSGLNVQLTQSNSTLTFLWSVIRIR